MTFYDPRRDEPGEKLARQLEALSDYRVLRRLPKPNEIWLRSMPTPDRAFVLGVVDVETTSLDAVNAKMIQIAIGTMTIDPEIGDLLDIRYPKTWFEDPDEPLPPEITRLTRITPEMLTDQCFPDKEIVDLLTSCDALAGHNAKFDAGFVRKRFPGVERPWCCSMREVNWADRGFDGGRGIGQLLTSAGFFLPNAHRADADTWATMCLLSIAGSSERTIAADLIDTARRNTARLYATDAPFACKDTLRAAGYRWSPERRAWWTEGDDERIGNEEKWLASLSPQIWPVIEKVTWFDRYL